MKRRRRIGLDARAVLAALAGLCCRVATQTVNAPDTITACTSATISWTAGTPPYDVSVRNSNDHVLLHFSAGGALSQDWIVNVTENTELFYKVNTVESKRFKVAPYLPAAELGCLPPPPAPPPAPVVNDPPAPAASSPAPSPSPSPSLVLFSTSSPGLTSSSSGFGPVRTITYQPFGSGASAHAPRSLFVYLLAVLLPWALSGLQDR